MNNSNITYPAPVAVPEVVVSDPDVNSLLEKAFAALGKKEWIKAKEYCNEAEKSGSNGWACLYRFMSTQGWQSVDSVITIMGCLCGSDEEYSEEHDAESEILDFKKAREFEDEALKTIFTQIEERRAFRKAVGEEVKYVIPGGVTEIESDLFSYISKLKEIVIPDTVTTIDQDAFTGCTGLTSVIIPGSVTLIGEGAFSDCCNLSDVTIQDGVKTIDKFAFARCRSLTSVTIPESVTMVGLRAFYNCVGIKTLTLLCAPSAVRNCAVFDGCKAVEAIYTKREYRSEYQLAFEHECSSDVKVFLTEEERCKLEEEQKRRQEQEVKRQVEERRQKIATLKAEKESIGNELKELKGIFSGVRRKKLNARLVEIENELNKLS